MKRANSKNKKNKVQFICYCNGIPKTVVENAIQNGCKTLSQIADRTNAGCGPCGGSCQPEILKLIKEKADEENGK